MVASGSHDDLVPATSDEVGRLRAIVTGAARGIGAEIACELVRNGADVVLVDRLADQCAGFAARIGARSVACDLSDPNDVARAMTEALGLLGGIDALVNNAGIFEISPLLDIDVASWDRMFDINVRSMLLTIQAAARAMIQQGRGGRIVNMASMGGKVGAAGQAHYAASKAAVISLTQVAADEFGPHQITVNAVCPGYVLTEMGATTRTDAMIADWSSLSPLGRLADPADVAGVVRFLISPDAAYLTGQAINVSGGMIKH